MVTTLTLNMAGVRSLSEEYEQSHRHDMRANIARAPAAGEVFEDGVDD